MGGDHCWADMPRNIVIAQNDYPVIMPGCVWLLPTFYPTIYWAFYPTCTMDLPHPTSRLYYPPLVQPTPTVLAKFVLDILQMGWKRAGTFPGRRCLPQLLQLGTEQDITPDYRTLQATPDKPRQPLLGVVPLPTHDMCDCNLVNSGTGAERVGRTLTLCAILFFCSLLFWALMPFHYYYHSNWTLDRLSTQNRAVVVKAGYSFWKTWMRDSDEQ